MCHTPKTNFRDTSGWSETDWSFAAEGTGGLANSTGMSLVIDQHGDGGRCYVFRAAKRGMRIGWTDARGELSREKYFRHSDGLMHWAEMTEEEREELADGAERRAENDRNRDLDAVIGRVARRLETVDGKVMAKADLVADRGLASSGPVMRAALSRAFRLPDPPLFEYLVGKDKIMVSTNKPEND